VVEKQTYDAKKSDYSLPIRRLLNVDESESRQKSLRRTLGSKIEFIPRRRQDIDFIFMAASSRQARLIPPQLRFHHAPKIPVYTTSHSYGGTVDPDMDRDMDGVQFSDMPWTLKQATPDNHLKADIRGNWPDMEKRYSRLYAMGIDAYYIIGQLNSLRRNRSSYYQGETGDLSLDINNRLQRRLTWARFERGIPQVLTNY
jgi:outer membrane PBP1 activator LpoA protein